MRARVMIDSCVFDAAHPLVAPPVGARPARELSGRAQGALLQVSTAFFMIIPLLLTTLPASGAEFSVLRPQQSSVTFVSRQMGVPVEGSFRKFTANIAVDPAKAETGTAHIDIDLASIDTGSDEANEEVASKAWFDTRNHPVARFVSSNVTRTGNGRYEVTGRMSIKGRTLNIKAPFTLKQEDNALIIDGMLPLRRLDYGIGSGVWSDTDTVADEVQIRFRFAVAAPKQ